jgi:hypothetical protein
MTSKTSTKSYKSRKHLKRPIVNPESGQTQVIVGASIPQSLCAEIDRMAAEQMRTRSAMIFLLLRDALNGSLGVNPTAERQRA